MNLPQFYGKFPQNDTVFYTAADEHYFNAHAKLLISSIRKNFDQPIHIHLYNASDETKNYCETNKISYSYEIFDENLVERAYDIYRRPFLDSELQKRRSKMMNNEYDYENIKKMLVKTYFACTRFIRLSQLLTNPTCILMLDADSIVRIPFTLPPRNYDIHIFEKRRTRGPEGKKHLASSIFYTGTPGSLKLIRDHSDLIIAEYQKDLFYWFLDQETLDVLLPKYKKRALAKYFVDWELNESSFIWCGKGAIKYNKQWIKETNNYKLL